MICGYLSRLHACARFPTPSAKDVWYALPGVPSDSHLSVCVCVCVCVYLVSVVMVRRCVCVYVCVASAYTGVLAQELQRGPPVLHPSRHGVVGIETVLWRR